MDHNQKHLESSEVDHNTEGCTCSFADIVLNEAQLTVFL